LVVESVDPFPRGEFHSLEVSPRKGMEDDVGIAIFGRPEGVVLKQATKVCTSRALPDGQDQPGDLIQLKKKYTGILPSEMKKLK
jgi:hypothetical protein